MKECKNSSMILSGISNVSMNTVDLCVQVFPVCVPGSAGYTAFGGSPTAGVHLWGKSRVHVYL